jgi:hypothetical protein
MCCFSGRVQSVSRTRIFARAAANDQQYVVYQMKVAVGDDVAMILPLPVPPRPREDAVRFINLERYPEFFDDLETAFPVVQSYGARAVAAGGPQLTPLAVHDVGAFEASFVPSIGAFDRLDQRFRLPDRLWAHLPQYRDWGFAVFKLKSTDAAGRDVHPMAFVFPRRDPDVLFFPTVHIHDGEVHERATFDHTLYLQMEGDPPEGWWLGPSSLAQSMDVALAGELIDPELRASRRVMAGRHKNEDILVPTLALAA